MWVCLWGKFSIPHLLDPHLHQNFTITKFETKNQNITGKIDFTQFSFRVGYVVHIIFRHIWLLLNAEIFGCWQNLPDYGLKTPLFGQNKIIILRKIKTKNCDLIRREYLLICSKKNWARFKPNYVNFLYKFFFNFFPPNNFQCHPVSNTNLLCFCRKCCYHLCNFDRVRSTDSRGGGKGTEFWSR